MACCIDLKRELGVGSPGCYTNIQMPHTKRGNPNWRIIKNDFRRNPVINIVLLLFMVLSATAAILSVLISTQTISSISTLNKAAQPPHFLQLHKGEIDQAKIDAFMRRYEDVTDWQTISMINVRGDAVSVLHGGTSKSMADTQIGINLVKQTQDKDLLVNATHEKVTLEKGEIGMPVLLKNLYDMEIGDTVVLRQQGRQFAFTIKEFVLDSQMNSSMVSSTRILLGDQDFAEVYAVFPEHESMIEAYFTNANEATAFWSTYQSAGLPQNGQAITYTMIFLLSSLSGLATALLLFVTSLLLVFVSLLCVRFTILATLEEEVSQIGTMKAIGLPFKDIRSMYLDKYRLLVVIAGIAALPLAFLASSVLTQQIQETFGSPGRTPLLVLLPIGTAVLFFIFIMLYCKKVLKRVKRLTIVDTLVYGKGLEGDKGKVKDGLSKRVTNSLNWTLAVRDLVQRPQKWLLLFFITAITSFMVLLPISLVWTLDSPSFAPYLGSAPKDILIELEDSTTLESNYSQVQRLLAEDADVASYDTLRRVSVETVDAEDAATVLHVDAGDTAGRGLYYLAGHAPRTDTEIALSVLNADKLGKKVGDDVKVSANDQVFTLKLAGIYQDVTSGGYTAKIIREFVGLTVKKYSISVGLHPGSNVQQKSREWNDSLGSGVTVYSVKSFIAQTLGGVVGQLTSVIFAVIVLGGIIATLVVALFLKLRLTKDRALVASLKTIGFTNADVKRQYAIRIIIATAFGALTGIVITALAGSSIINAILSVAGLGIRQIVLVPIPLVYGVCFVSLVVWTACVSWWMLRSIDKSMIVSVINE